MARLLQCCAIVLLLGVALVLAVDEVKDKPKTDGEKGKDAAGTVTSAATVTEAPKSLPKVCDVCGCTVEIIDCSSRNLNSNLYDHEWPKGVIKIVTFENNEITKIRQFPNATVLQLSLAKNKIEKIEPEAFKWLANLTELDLSHNELSYENLMPNAFEGRFRPEAYEPLEKLKKLNLAFNKFHSLNHDLFEHVEDLKVLILSNNPFTIFNPSSIVAISAIPYLEDLQLSGCQLEKLEEATLHSLRYLKTLDVSYNAFETLPEALRHASVLENLTLDGNPIKSLGYDNSFPKMPHLKTLNLANMPELIEIQKGALSNLEALENLNIENCPKLKEISDLSLAKPSELGTTWPTLRSINMSNSALNNLPANFVARWDKIETLSLRNNPWACDCDNQYLIGTLLPQLGKKLMPADIANLRCSSPPEHVNKTLISLANWKLRCPDLYGARPEHDAAVLVGMLIGVLLAIPVVFIFFVLWRRGYFFCGSQGPASFSRAFYKRTSPYDDDV